MNEREDILHRAFYKVGIILDGVEVELEFYFNSTKPTIGYTVSQDDFKKICQRYVMETKGVIYGYSQTPSKRYLIAGATLVNGTTFRWETFGMDFSLWDTSEGEKLGRELESELRSRLAMRAA